MVTIEYLTQIKVKATFKEGSEQELIKKLKQGYLPSDLMETELGFIDSKFLLDTEESLSPNEVDGMKTISLFKDDKPLWDNSYERQIEDETDRN